MKPRARKLQRHTNVGHFRFDSFESFLATPLQNGLSSVLINNRWFDVLYENRNSDVTVVAYHAAVAPGIPTYPMFSSRKNAHSAEANYLGFADAACGSAESLPTFWHMSTRRVDAQKFIPKTIRHALKNERGKHLIFFGSSAGGFAALNYSSKFPGSVAVVMNPRISLKATPNRFDDYARIAYPGWEPERVAKKVPVCMANLYSEPQGNIVAYLQNTQDKTYFDHHYSSFAASTLGRKDIFVRKKPWGMGHVVPPREEFVDLLDDLVANAPNWEFVLNQRFSTNSDSTQAGPLDTDVASMARHGALERQTIILEAKSQLENASSTLANLQDNTQINVTIMKIDEIIDQLRKM